MSLHPRDPGISKFAIPSISEMVNLLSKNDLPGDLVFQGGDLAPATVLSGYRSGIFPMPVSEGVLGWFCPQERAIFLTTRRFDGTLPCRTSKSLRKSMSKFTFSIDTSFLEVIERCAQPERPGAWITPEIIDAYFRLHQMGWAHSIEVWDKGGALVGGLYGISIGGFFAGESMFHAATDGSKAALVALVHTMAENGGLLIDAQWLTPHLKYMGATSLPRLDYLALLGEALGLALPDIFTSGYKGPLPV